MKILSRNSKKSDSKSKKTDKKPKYNTKRLTVDLIVLACVILLGISGWLWWSKIFMNPDRALKAAIDNSLQTKSVTKRVKQSGGGNSEIDQTTFVSFYPPKAATQTRTVLSQGFGSTTTSVTTETIGTNDADYVRYVASDNTNNLPGGDALTKLFGVWAKRTANPATGDQVTFINESLYGVIPFGNLDAAQSSKLRSLIAEKGVYRYTSVERRIENKRPVFVYDMSIKSSDLVSVIKEYFQITGIGDPSQLNPEDYAAAGNLSIKLTVDILSRQITQIEYPTGRVETYSGQDLYRPVDIPKDTIPVDELQKRLQGEGA